MTTATLQLAVVSAAFDADLRLAAPAARLAGFGAVQLEAQSATLDVTNLAASGRREIRHLLSAQDLALAGLRAEVGSKGFSPSVDIDRILARLEGILEGAAGLAAPLVCLDIGPLPEPAKAPKPQRPIAPEQIGAILIPTLARPAPAVVANSRDTAALDSTLAASVDGALAELGRRADRYSVTIAFRSELASYSALDRALRAAACPWFAVDLDPVAVLRDDLSGDEIFSMLAGQIRHVRGRDAALGADRRTKPAVLGRGSVNWPEVLSHLDSSGYHGFVSIDPLELTDRASAASSAGAALRKWMR